MFFFVIAPPKHVCRNLAWRGQQPLHLGALPRGRAGSAAPTRRSSPRKKKGRRCFFLRTSGTHRQLGRLQWRKGAVSWTMGKKGRDDEETGKKRVGRFLFRVRTPCARRGRGPAQRALASKGTRAPNLRWAVSAPAPRPLACARPVLASPRRDLCPRSKAAMCACPHPPRRFALDSTEGQKVKGVRVRVCRQRQRRPRGRSRGRYRHTRGAGCPSAAARGTCARCCPLFLPWRCPRASLHAQQEAAPCACCPARKCDPHALAILVLGAARCLAPGRR